MLQIFLGTYLVLSLLVLLLIWAALAVSRIHDTEEMTDDQRLYQIASAISKLKYTGNRKEHNLVENPVSLRELGLPLISHPE